MVEARANLITDTGACIFRCGKTIDDAMIAVEMLVDEKGEFQSGQGTHAYQRVPGKAHVECYKDWYEQTYKSPFTMSA